MKNEPNNRNFEVRAFTRLMGGIVVLAFIAGIMVDLDHPLALVLGISNERFLHPYFAVAGLGSICIGLGLVITCLCRYIFPGFLGKKDL